MSRDLVLHFPSVIHFHPHLIGPSTQPWLFKGFVRYDVCIIMSFIISVVCPHTFACMYPHRPSYDQCHVSSIDHILFIIYIYIYIYKSAICGWSGRGGPGWREIFPPRGHVVGTRDTWQYGRRSRWHSPVWPLRHWWWLPSFSWPLFCPSLTFLWGFHFILFF